MRLVHFVHQGRLVGGLEQLLNDVLAAPVAGLEHAVVLHWGERCEFAGRWPVRRASWSAEGTGDPEAVVRAVRELGGACLFHAPPHQTVTEALGSAGLPLSVFCHGHEWWCASASRYYAHTSQPCAIHASTAACALRYHALGCGSLRLGNALRGLSRAGAGRAALAAADYALVLSAFMARDAERHGAASGHVRVIPAPTSFAGASVPPVPPGEPHILFAARLTKEKGIGDVLDAFARVRPGPVLEIAGSGIAGEATVARASAHSASSRITLLGELDRTAIRHAIERAALVVVPSVWPEPFGIVGIEALALGRPVVATDVGGMGEWARAELGVLTVPAGDSVQLAAAIHRILDEPEWRQRAAAAGAKRIAEHHTPARCAEAMAGALGG